MPPKHIEEAERIAKEHDEAIASGNGQPPAEGEGQQPPPEGEGEGQPPPAPAADEGGWEQRYLSLKGKYDSEVPRLSNDLREARGQLTDLSSRLAAVEQQPTPPAPAATPPATISDEDIENFGPELADFIKRQATIVADGMVGSLRQENAQLKQQVEQTAAATGTVQADRYFTKLAELVPDYEAVNVDPAFLSWLAEMDVMAGVPRQAFLNTAFESRDAVRTANVFKAYKEATGAGTPAPASRETPAPVAPATGNGNGNGQSISPGSGTGGQASGSADGERVWSGADIKAFTNEILRGQYKGKEAEMNAIQADIDKAIVEGRIRP